MSFKTHRTHAQAHDISVRTMVWSHNDSWMVTGDHGGYVKYWQSNMNNVKMYQAHKEAIRGIRYCQMFVIVICIYPFAAAAVGAASMGPPPNHPKLSLLLLDRIQLQRSLQLVHKSVDNAALSSFFLCLFIVFVVNLHFLPSGGCCDLLYSIKPSRVQQAMSLNSIISYNWVVSAFDMHIPHKVPQSHE